MPGGRSPRPQWFFAPRGAQGRFVSVPRQVAMTAHNFLACFDPDQPLGFFVVPGNFHSIRSHISSIPFRCPAGKVVTKTAQPKPHGCQS